MVRFVSNDIADDAQIHKMFAAVNMHESVIQIKIDVKAVNDWTNENHLALNARKTQAIIFRSDSSHDVPLVYLHVYRNS